MKSYVSQEGIERAKLTSRNINFCNCLDNELWESPQKNNRIVVGIHDNKLSLKIQLGLCTAQKFGVDLSLIWQLVN